MLHIVVGIFISTDSLDYINMSKSIFEVYQNGAHIHQREKNIHTHIYIYDYISGRFDHIK